MPDNYPKVIIYSILILNLMFTAQCKKDQSEKTTKTPENKTSLPGDSSNDKYAFSPTYKESGGKIICTTENPKGSLHQITLQKFAALLKKYSKGKLEAEVHYKGNKKYPAIKGEETNINMISIGKGGVHVTVVAAGNISRKAQVLEFLTLPYIFKNVNSAKNLFKSDYMNKEIHRTVIRKHNLRILGWLIGGYRHMTNSKRPVQKLEDIKGLKIRTPMNRIMRETYTSFGAKVQTIRWRNTFNALKNGIVDGQENPFCVIADSKFWEAKQKYITLNGPFLWVGPIVMDERYYQSLPDDLKKALDRAAKEAVYYEWNWMAQKEKYFENILRKNGMKILTLTDKTKWIDSTKKIWQDAHFNIGYGNRAAGKKVLDKVISIAL
ncbi:MAG: TRAP transporter substrate-binding protein [bacterium]|nr:TRAP transporter substrate-binding protein [bacterium]